MYHLQHSSSVQSFYHLSAFHHSYSVALAFRAARLAFSFPLLNRPSPDICKTASRKMTGVLAASGQENFVEPAQKVQKLSSGSRDPGEIPPLLVKRLSEHAILPKRGSAGAAGYDLSSAVDCTIPARGRAVVSTDLSIAIPSGTYARVAPRSGLAVKHFIDTGAGVVDEDYRGTVGVVLFNHADTNFQVKRGDRIAQLILERIVTPEVMEVQDLDETVRGSGGFGSTGVSIGG